METGEPQETGPDRVGNVVRIPRDWFGPPEELVPFGPRAYQADLPTTAGDDAPDPNSFWDGSSSSFQDVVEAPAGNGRRSVGGYRFGGRIAVLAARSRGVWEAIGGRKAAVGVVVSLLAALGVVAWLLGGSQPRAGQSAIAAVSPWHTPSSFANAPSLMYRRPAVVPMPRTFRKRHTAASPRHSQTVRVVYHANEPTVPAPSRTSKATVTTRVATTSAAQSSAAGTRSGATEASTAAPAQSSSPAFGANGALGPMSSPDG